mgnify:CR=1 FL=1
MSENLTLEVMLDGLNASVDVMVIMNAGIDTDANLILLVEHGCRYGD